MPRSYYLLFLVLGLVLLVGWQINIARSSENLDSSYTRTDATGLMIAAARPFTYFYYYLNLYPLRTKHEPLIYSKEGAQKIIKEYPQTLWMEHSYYVLWGEQLRTPLLLIDAFLKGSPVNPSIKPFSIIFFVTSLALLLVSFFLIRRPLLGIILVLLLGSNPFQLYEIYANENIFGFNISLLLFILAINLPLLTNLDLPHYFPPLASIFSGVILGAAMHIRTEAVFSSLGLLILVYTLYFKKPFKKRVLVIGLLLVSSFLVSKGWKYYFDYKFNQAYTLAKEVRGPSFSSFLEDIRGSHHTFWHPIFTGLGDFDQKYGYAWDDNVAYNYAAPFLETKIRQKYGELFLLGRETWTIMPEYTAIVREKVVRDITHDPVWYLTILAQRVERMFSRVTPVSLNLNGTFKFSIPINGIVFVPIFLFYLYKWDWFSLKLLTFSLSLSAVIVLVYSGKNITSLSVYHLFAAALFLEPLIKEISAKLYYNWIGPKVSGREFIDGIKNSFGGAASS